MINIVRTLTLTVFSLAALTVSASAVMAAECILPAAPQIPAGATASEDDMLAASQAVKAYQAELTKFRGCLSVEREAIEGTEEADNDARKALNERYNGSIDTEETVATAFNAQIRVYNAAKKAAKKE